MYYRVDNNGQIIDFSATKYSDACLFTEEDIVIAWDNLAYIKGTEPEEPLEVKNRRITEALTKTAQEYLDFAAQAMGYTNCNSACTYIDTGVRKYDIEGAAFRKWRSAVWNNFYDILAEVLAGDRAEPSVDELVKLLPKLEISYA